MWICTGSAERFYALVQTVRSWPEPLFEGIRSMPLPVLQSMFDSHRPPGHYWWLKTDVFDVLSTEAIRAHSEHGSRLPTAISTIHLYPINGAVHRKAISDTAFPFRKALWAEAIAGVDPAGRNLETIKRWTRETWEAVHAYSAGGAYSNFLTDAEPERVAAAYGSNYARLQRIKSQHDPGERLSCES